MNIYRGFSNYSPVKNAIVTTGTFDGVHVGHKTIIKRLKGIARKYNGESVLITFYPHPRLVLQKNSGLKLLSTIEERIELLEECGIDHLIIIPFDKAFAKLSSTQFVEDVLVKMVGTKRLVIGYDHHFGRNREGSLKHLLKFGPKYGFEVEEIPALEVDRVNVSSTIIREALLKGQVRKATEFLEHPYTLKGIVVDGDKIGRSIGFPTANVKIKEDHKLVPKQGVYAVKVKHGNIFHKGMLNIGRRPTLGSNNDLTIEVHIFDFNSSIYGEELKLEIIQFVRNEINFSDVTGLKVQLELDLNACKKILSLK